MGYKKVTKDEFYGIIREKELDVVVSVYGDRDPFVNYFKFRDGRVFGYEDRDGTHYIKIEEDT